MRRLLWGVAGVALAAAVAVCVIPVPKSALDFSQARHPAGASTPAPANPTYREVRWSDLTPPGWDPYQQLGELDQRIRSVQDTDAVAKALQQNVRAIWDNAPVNPAIEGAAIRIPGFVVPLDDTHTGLKTFLLVPYFGACIHSPPPPSNQIVQVVMNQPLQGLRSMDTVWVSGTLRAVRQDSQMGMSSYQLQAVAVDRYQVGERL